MQNAVQDSAILLQETEDSGVLRLTLNDAKRRNALSEAMMAALSAALDAAGSNPAVRVAHTDRGRAYFTTVLANCSALMQAIVHCPKPVIAEVTGIATAAGCQLVASCDLALAADTAQFSTPGVHIGLFCSTPMVALSRNVADKHAMEMLLTGEMTSAARAAEIGLINRAVAADALRDATMALARKIALKSSMTLATGKRAYYAQRELGLSDAYAYASAVMVDNMLTLDAEEGIGAFIEKRAPKWQDV